jgi:hypothetical protein
MNRFGASTAIQVIHAECIPISMRRKGSSGTPDEWILPVKIRRRKIDMDRTVFFISIEIY